MFIRPNLVPFSHVLPPVSGRWHSSPAWKFGLNHLHNHRWRWRTDMESSKNNQLDHSSARFILTRRSIASLGSYATRAVGSILRLLSLYIICFSTTANALALNAASSDKAGGMKGDGKNTIRCYSCMSPFYESAWVHGMSRWHAKPMNFSQQCDYQSQLEGIGLVECPSVCIKMREDTELSAIPFRGYIRGCFDTMLRHGFNQTMVRWYRWLQRDSCMDYNKYQILQLPSTGRSSSKNMIHICTCYADRCNGSSSKFSLFKRRWLVCRENNIIIASLIVLAGWRTRLGTAADNYWVRMAT